MTEEEIFLHATALPRDKRSAYLDGVCSNDLELRGRLEQLLAAQDDDAFMLRVADRTFSAEVAEAAAGLRPEESGERISNYKLLQQIGQGGFGSVWMAEQERPVRRRVALKIIKLGMDTKEVIARFEQERQALAMMDHPNIAKVLDAGATPSGRPYFVMELVHGVKITEYCDHALLSTKDRLKLFIAVCQAVQHAHQKGIIHRDLKPSNILVTLHDGVPVPKVIDFGVAKATEQRRLTDLTLFTQFEQMIGTPLYMAPEQAELSGLDIDTRSDIYSLGVLLYELLTGRTPFDPEALMKAGFDEMRRVIREDEPQKPSTFLGTMALEKRIDVAKHRQSDGAKLIGAIRGDLDWIVMKALEKDRSRRYENATGLARDIERHLISEPVLARPPSATYRFCRLVQRNKGAFVSASAVLVAILVGFGVSVRMYLHEKQARERAMFAEKVQEQERRRAEQVSKFLKEMLSGVTPAVAQGRDTTLLRQILDKTAERLSNDLRDQPDIESELRTIVGSVYYSLGEYGSSLKMEEQVLAFREKWLGSQHPLVAESLTNIGLVLDEQRRIGEAEAKFRSALAIFRKALPEENIHTARTLISLAYNLKTQTKYVEAERLARESLAVYDKLLGSDHLTTERCVRCLEQIARDTKKDDPDVAQRIKRIRTKSNKEGSAEAASVILDRAHLLSGGGKFKEAEAGYRSAIATFRKIYGDAHPGIGPLLVALGNARLKQHDLSGAESAFGEGLEILKKAFGDRGLPVAQAMDEIAHHYEESHPSKAESLFRAALNLPNGSGGVMERDLRDETLLGIHGCLTALLSERAWLARTTTTEGTPLLREDNSSDFSPAEVAMEAEKIARYVLERRVTDSNEQTWEADLYRSRVGASIIARAVTESGLSEQSRLGKLRSAEELLLPGAERLLSGPGVSKSVYRRFPVVWLHRLYEVWVQPEKASLWKGKLDTFDEARRRRKEAAGKLAVDEDVAAISSPAGEIPLTK